MRAIFKHDPEARIKTGYYVRGGSTREERREARDAFDYKGHRDFEHKFPKTAHINIGSMMYPGFPIDACTCRQGEWGVDHNVGGTYAVSMERTMIQGCPHVIFTPDHYRADGSCKCNEKDNSDMKEWGYTWNEQQEVWTC